MDILQYLLELLKTRKQIGLEGLGTFYKKKTPGRYDAGTHSFLPPSYALEFTPELLENTKLAEYIQTKRGISEDSAKYFINQFVGEIQQSLQNGTFTLEHLGTFVSEGEKLVFNASQDINTGFDFFALPSVTAELKPIQENVVEEASNVSSDHSEVSAEHQIEQVKVPEFEQELSKIEFTETTTSGSSEKDVDGSEENAVLPEEDLPKVEKHTSEVEEIQATEEAETTVTINEPKETEVIEENEKEVEVENIPNEIAVTAEEEKETWNFDDEHVVSPEDISNEETVNSPTSKVENIEPANGKEDIKLKSTTHEWSFDTIESNKTVAEDNTLIGEFDNQYVEEEYTEEKPKMPLYQKLSLALLVIAVAFVTLYFVKPEIFENFRRDTTNPDEKIVVPIQRSNLKTQKDSLSFADSIMKNAEKVGLEVQPAKDTLVVTTSKKDVPVTYTYDVIIASFATEAKAQDYIGRMKKKGFDAKISTMHGKRKNISIATYNNIDSAQKYVIKFRKQFNNKDIYAQPIKNK